MKDHGPSVKSEAYTQDDLMRSQESPPTIGTLVKNHLDEMASGIHTAHTSQREQFSYKRLQPVLSICQASFDDGKVFSSGCPSVLPSHGSPPCGEGLGH